MGLRRSALSIALLALLTGAGAALPFPAPAQQKQNEKDRPAAVGVDGVIAETARQTVPIIGRLVAQNAGVVSAQVKGVVTQMRISVGDRVKRGDVLAVLDPDSLKWSRELRAAEVKSAEADLTTARAQATLRRQELQRLENLRKSSAFSPARFEDAQQELVKAEGSAARAGSELMVAKANLNLADIDLANAEVKAPYEGVVTTTHTAVGTYLTVGQSVATLIDDTHLEIEADVPADRIGGLTAGAVVNFMLGADRKERFAVVRAVVPEENPLTRTRKVRFSPADDDLGQDAAANQSVSVAVPAGAMRSVVTVHKDAVVNKGGRDTVFIVEDNKANVRPVELGEAVGGRFIVLSGLKPGDLVVVRGNERLRPGQDVEPRPGTKP